MHPSLLETLTARVLERAPAFQEFMLVGELYESSRKLTEEHGDVAEVVEAGESRARLPLEALIIRGGDERRVLAYAFPHPNEPVGSLTLEALSWILARDRDILRATRATWILVKVADVYGALLNEGWFKGPFTLEKYLLNYYRPPPYRQVEWTFPIEYKTLKWDKPTPETRALMKLIEEWRPTHLYSLHNAYFTGTFYYVSRKPPGRVMEMLAETPRSLGVPLHKGAPEAPYIKRLGDGVFTMYSIVDEYDWLEKHADRDPAGVLRVGDNGYGYARRLNPDVFAMICEVPYIYDDRLDNTTRIGIPLREIYRLTQERGRGNLEEMRSFTEKVDPYMSPDNPYYEGWKEFLDYLENYDKAGESWLEKDPGLDKPATVAQALHAYMVTVWERMAFYSRMYKALTYEEKRGRTALPGLKEEALARMRRNLELFENLVDYRVIPVGSLVKIQLAAVIATAAQGPI